MLENKKLEGRKNIMQERDMTQEEAEIFGFYLFLNDDLRRCGDILYWYRSGESVEKIFLNDQIQLRLTHVDCFDDKLEGRAAEIYYDIAMEELLQEKAIGKELFDRFSQVVAEETELFISGEENGIRIVSMKKYDAYIVCFSEVENDPYMFDRYGKYCFTLSKSMLVHELRERFADRIRCVDLRILYGRQAVEYLKKEIMEKVRDEFLLQNAEMLLRDQLHELLYAAKRPRYALENEVRLVIFVPKDYPCDGGGIKKEEVNKNGITKKYLYLTLGKNVFYDVSPSPENTVEDTNRVFSVLDQRGYSYLLPDEE